MVFISRARRLTLVGVFVLVLLLPTGASAQALTPSLETGWYDAKADCDLAGNGTDDDRPELQNCLNAIATIGNDATLFFPEGTYLLSSTPGANNSWPDASNAQIQLPQVADKANHFSLRLMGPTPPPTFGLGHSGAILRSTLTAANNATGKSIIGVKGTSDLDMTRLSVTIQDLTVRAPSNPALTGIDLRYVPNTLLQNVKVDVAVSPSITDVNFPEPTTTSSYGIRTALNNIPDVAILENVQVTGFHNGFDLGELADARDITANFTIYPVEIGTAFHEINIDRLTVTESQHGIRFTGEAYVTVYAYDADRNARASNPWWNKIDDITDPQNLGRGTIVWHTVTQDVGPTGAFVKDGAKRLRVTSVGNLTEAFNNSTTTANPVVELNSYTATSNDTNFPALNMVTKQSGTNNGIGAIWWVNSILDPSQQPNGNRRLAGFSAFTDGATNSGAMLFGTANNGTFSVTGRFDHDGNWVVKNGFTIGKSGGALPIVNGTITPTAPVHHVNTGTFHTIAVPAGFMSTNEGMPTAAAGTITIIPDGAFQTQDTGGNIALSSTAVPKRAMTFTWDGTKWYPSY